MTQMEKIKAALKQKEGEQRMEGVNPHQLLPCVPAH